VLARINQWSHKSEREKIALDRHITGNMIILRDYTSDK
jgi:hypothetical protein